MFFYLDSKPYANAISRLYFLWYPLGDNPEYTTVANTDLPDSERVGVISFGDELRVYPYPHTFTTEIINDAYQSQKYAFSYCPLTKSAIAFTRNKTFRASGYLYKNNMDLEKNPLFVNKGLYHQLSHLILSQLWFSFLGHTPD